MNTTTEKPKTAGPIPDAALPYQPKRRAKWKRLADEARGRIAARDGWDKSLNPDVQIAREIAANPVTAKAFLRSAKGNQGTDPQALRHRLLAEVRRSAPEPVARPRDREVSIFRRWVSTVRKFFR